MNVINNLLLLLLLRLLAGFLPVLRRFSRHVLQHLRGLLLPSCPGSLLQRLQVHLRTHGTNSKARCQHTQCPTPNDEMTNTQRPTLNQKARWFKGKAASSVFVASANWAVKSEMQPITFEPVAPLPPEDDGVPALPWLCLPRFGVRSSTAACIALTLAVNFWARTAAVASAVAAPAVAGDAGLFMCSSTSCAEVNASNGIDP